jgi:murein DD-endopeptidase MepM/ murein hydrolase activator NlpD
MKSFKNWEKRLASSFEKFVRRTFEFISTKWKQFIKKGNEKVTLMLIPHNQKKIFNVHMSIFSIAFFIITISLLFIVFFISISTLSSTVDQLSHFKLQYMKYRANYDDMINQINEIYNKIVEATAESTKLAYFFLGQKNWNQGGIGGPDIEKDKVADPYEQLSVIKEETELFYMLFKEYNNRQPFLEDLAQTLPSRWPFVDGSGSITSGFGFRRHPVLGGVMFHTGVDIASFPGALICATADGVVKFSGWREGYGIAIVIEHPRGFETLYGHLMMSLVRPGEVVKKGQSIAKEGSTGQVTGPHLHYEVRMNGQFINPEYFLHLYFDLF